MPSRPCRPHASSGRCFCLFIVTAAGLFGLLRYCPLRQGALSSRWLLLPSLRRSQPLSLRLISVAVLYCLMVLLVSWRSGIRCFFWPLPLFFVRSAARLFFTSRCWSLHQVSVAASCQVVAAGVFIGLSCCPVVRLPLLVPSSIPSAVLFVRPELPVSRPVAALVPPQSRLLAPSLVSAARSFVWSLLLFSPSCLSYCSSSWLSCVAFRQLPDVGLLSDLSCRLFRLVSAAGSFFRCGRGLLSGLWLVMLFLHRSRLLVSPTCFSCCLFIRSEVVLLQSPVQLMLCRSDRV